MTSARRGNSTSKQGTPNSEEEEEDPASSTSVLEVVEVANSSASEEEADESPASEDESRVLCWVSTLARSYFSHSRHARLAFGGFC